MRYKRACFDDPPSELKHAADSFCRMQAACFVRPPPNLELETGPTGVTYMWTGYGFNYIGTARPRRVHQQ
eukprot:6786847-Alexandrium_andersonii.AAC.1